MPSVDPTSCANSRVLGYSASRRVQCVSIETYSDGVLIVAHFSWARWLFHFALLTGTAVFFIAIAWPSRDGFVWQGITIQRAGTLARVVSGVIGTLSVTGVLVALIAPRGATTLVARSGKFGYASPGWLSGIEFIDCALNEIETIDHEPRDGEHRAALAIKVARFGRRRLFWRQESTEIKAIAEALIPVWQKERAINGGNINPHN